MLAQIQDNTYKAYVALQSYVTPPANIPIPGVVRTDRTKLTREQMAARYLKSVEGNPDIDINKARREGQQTAPKMIQKSSTLSIKDQWQTNDPVGLSDESKMVQASRNLLATEDSTCPLNFAVYSDLAQKNSDKIVYQVFGTLESPDLTCMADTPEFVVCSDQYLPLTDLTYWTYPAQTLWFRKAPDTDTEYPQPNLPTSPDEINTKIHDTLQNNKATRIYLSPKQLDSYLNWRISHGGLINFKYIKVEDAEVDRANKNLIVAIGGGLGICTVLAYAAHRGCKYSVEEKANALRAKVEALRVKAKARHAEKKADALQAKVNVLREEDQSTTAEQWTADEEMTVFSKNENPRLAGNEKNTMESPEGMAAIMKNHRHNTLIDTPTLSANLPTAPSSSPSSSIVASSTSDEDSTSDDSVVSIPDQVDNNQ